MWMLDDGPLGDLAQLAGATWIPGVLHVGEATADAARLDKSSRRAKLVAMRVASQPVIAVHAVPPSSETWTMLFTHLRNAPPMQRPTSASTRRSRSAPVS